MDLSVLVSNCLLHLGIDTVELLASSVGLEASSLQLGRTGHFQVHKVALDGLIVTLQIGLDQTNIAEFRGNTLQLCTQVIKLCAIAFNLALESGNFDCGEREKMSMSYHECALLTISCVGDRFLLLDSVLQRGLDSDVLRLQVVVHALEFGKLIGLIFSKLLEHASGLFE